MGHGVLSASIPAYGPQREVGVEIIYIDNEAFLSVLGGELEVRSFKVQVLFY